MKTITQKKRVKLLKDSVIRNERLTSMDKMELCSWVECVMDYDKWLGERKSENERLEKELAEAKEMLKEYIRISLQAPINRSFDDETNLYKRVEYFLLNNPY